MIRTHTLDIIGQGLDSSRSSQGQPINLPPYPWLILPRPSVKSGSSTKLITVNLEWTESVLSLPIIIIRTS